MHNISHCLNWIQEAVKNLFTCHYILHPQPPQPKSCTCFYAHYISFLGENIYVLSPETCVLLKATEETGLKLNMDIAKHMLHELETKLKSALINSKYFKIYVCEHFLSSHTSNMTGN